MGVEWTEFTGSAGAKWLIGAVARVMKPGCQVDTCLVLEGEQGIRKSSVLRALAGDDWFTDQIADPTDIKESSQDLAGKWIVEISELDKYSKHEQGVIKSFIPRRTDHYRPSYGRHSADFPRQCIFSATTNKTEYLGDETGGRRWWPVTCGSIDFSRVAEDRDQLWAEAVAKYQDSAQWWIDDEKPLKLAKEAQQDRLMVDPWLSPIEFFIEELSYATNVERKYYENSVSIDQIMARLNIPTAQIDDQKTKRVVKCLRTMGWTRYRESEKPRPWRYKPPTTPQ
jgi:predicted P-loop ATPase